MARTHSKRKRIPSGECSVKARIVEAGVKLGDVARRARISQPALTGYLSGRLRNPVTQLRILMAFLHLTRPNKITMSQFWGNLCAKEAA